MVALIWVGQDEVLGSEIALQAVSGHQTGDKDVFCGPLSTVGTKREAEDEGSRFLSSPRMDSLTAYFSYRANGATNNDTCCS